MKILSYPRTDTLYVRAGTVLLRVNHLQGLKEFHNDLSSKLNQIYLFMSYYEYHASHLPSKILTRVCIPQILLNIDIL